MTDSTPPADELDAVALEKALRDILAMAVNTTSRKMREAEFIAFTAATALGMEDHDPRCPIRSPPSPRNRLALRARGGRSICRTFVLLSAKANSRQQTFLSGAMLSFVVVKPSPPLSVWRAAMGRGSPAAWRVKDFADGWILCATEAAARREADGAGNLVQPLYASPNLVDELQAVSAERDRLREALAAIKTRAFQEDGRTLEECAAKCFDLAEAALSPRHLSAFTGGG